MVYIVLFPGDKWVCLESGENLPADQIVRDTEAVWGFLCSQAMVILSAYLHTEQKHHSLDACALQHTG